jgi:hypothetical protein
MASRAINNEIGYAIRLLLSSIPTLRASAEQRSDFHLLKAEVYELWAAAEPGIAAQAIAIAADARREAHAINLDY